MAPTYRLQYTPLEAVFQGIIAHTSPSNFAHITGIAVERVLIFELESIDMVLPIPGYTSHSGSHISSTGFQGG